MQPVGFPVLGNLRVAEHDDVGVGTVRFLVWRHIVRLGRTIDVLIQQTDFDVVN